jgi:hypothetical protein
LNLLSLTHTPEAAWTNGLRRLEAISTAAGLVSIST